MGGCELVPWADTCYQRAEGENQVALRPSHNTLYKSNMIEVNSQKLKNTISIIKSKMHNQIKLKVEELRRWREGSVVNSMSDSCRRSALSSCTHMTTHNHIELEFQGI